MEVTCIPLGRHVPLVLSPSMGDIFMSMAGNGWEIHLCPQLVMDERYIYDPGW